MEFLQDNIKRLQEAFAGPKTEFQFLSDLHLDHESQYLTFHRYEDPDTRHGLSLEAHAIEMLREGQSIHTPCSCTHN